MKTSEINSGRILSRSEQRNVNGGDDGGADCLQDNVCFFPIAGGITATGTCATNSNAQCVCDAQANYGQSIVADFCKRH